MPDDPPVLPPTIGEIERLKQFISDLKKSKDADSDRITTLEAKLDAALKAMTAKREESGGSILDLF